MLECMKHCLIGSEQHLYICKSERLKLKCTNNYPLWALHTCLTEASALIHVSSHFLEITVVEVFYPSISITNIMISISLNVSVFSQNLTYKFDKKPAQIVSRI